MHLCFGKLISVVYERNFNVIKLISQNYKTYNFIYNLEHNVRYRIKHHPSFST